MVMFMLFFTYFGGGLVTKACPTLATPWTVACQAPLWDSPGKNTGVGCHFLLQGIFPTQESNPSLLHCRQNTYFSIFESFTISVCYFYNFIFRKGKTDLKSEVSSHSQLGRSGI